VKCVKGEFRNLDLAHRYLLAYVMVQRSAFWYHHGERFNEPSVEVDNDDDTNEYDEMQDILRDLYPEFNEEDSFVHESQEEEPNNEAKRFYRLLKDSQEFVDDGCKSSKMSTLVKPCSR